jgi:hypothetical protein
VASIRTNKRTGNYLIVFRFREQQFQRSLDTTSLRKAMSMVARVEETIHLIERGLMLLPNDADPATFILSDGRVVKTDAEPKPRTLDEVFAAYLKTVSNGVKEVTTIEGETMHMRHILRVIRGSRPAQSITPHDLQRFKANRTLQR